MYTSRTRYIHVQFLVFSTALSPILHLHLQIAQKMLWLFVHVISTAFRKKTPVNTLKMASQNFFTESTGKPFLVVAEVRNKSTGIFPQMGGIQEYVEKALLA